MFLSIVAPVYNEEEAIGEFIDRALTAAKASAVSGFELILVNDGSRDGSGEILLERAGTEAPWIKVVELSRNFGQQAAFHAGLSVSRGDLVVTLDSDLQDPPELIPKMVDRMGDGFDLVYARRVSLSGSQHGASGHTGMKSLGAFLYHALTSRRKTVPIPRNVGEYRCVRREMVRRLMEFSEHTIFLPGLVAYLGFSAGTVDYVRQQRRSHKQASFLTLMMRALDALTTFSVLPLNLILGLGLAAWTLPVLMALWIIVGVLRHGEGPTLMAAIGLAALVGWCALLTTLAVLGHYVGRVFLEVKARPRYFIKRAVGFSKDVWPT